MYALRRHQRSVSQGHERRGPGNPIPDLSQGQRSIVCWRHTLIFINTLLANFGSEKGDVSGAQFTDAFKRDAVAQVADMGYVVCEVAGREHQVDLHMAKAISAAC
jgi:hypothetical protein